MHSYCESDWKYDLDFLPDTTINISNNPFIFDSNLLNLTSRQNLFMNREHQKLTFWDNQRVGLNLSPTKPQLNCRAFCGKENTQIGEDTPHASWCFIISKLRSEREIKTLNVLFALRFVSCLSACIQQTASREPQCLSIRISKSQLQFILRSTLVPFCNQLREHVFTFTENP